MKTLRKQTSLFTEEESTSSQADFLASRTALPERDSARKMRDTSGQRCLEQFGRFNHVGLWAKTFSDLLIGQEGWFSTRCKLIWRLKGTKYNRMYFQLYPSTLHTEETEFGLLPTPTGMVGDAYADNSPNSHLRHTQNIATLAAKRLLPTPISSDKNHGTQVNQSFNKRLKKGYMAELVIENANKMLPTPAASDWKGAYRPESMKNKDGTFSREERLVNIYLKTGEEYNSKTSQLSPHFVMEMMGFPTDWILLPFLNGETSPSKQEATQ
jgi:hypothetical protein